jgi:S-adenosylmethionine:tRNA ribosyltransferase-isomerase
VNGAVAEPTEAREPAEVRGAGRDDVRLLVAHCDGRIEHRRFPELAELLAPGDVLVINTSGTLPAALPARGSNGQLTLHLSTPLPGAPELWLVELREGMQRSDAGRPGEVLLLPEGGLAVLLDREDGGRLWRASLRLPAPVPHYLVRHGKPIRYRHAERTWPIDRYQTVYATEAGSAEMPSAGRAFTPDLITSLVAAGIDVAPLVLHTGVSSLEAGERPYPEWFRVPRFTAERVRLARALGGRAIAVGTTVVRALEASAGEASEGWTDLVIAPDTPITMVDGLLSGFHDLNSTHLAMLEALADADLLERSYAEATQAGYLRHEFGDLHLILP